MAPLPRHPFSAKPKPAPQADPCGPVPVLPSYDAHVALMEHWIRRRACLGRLRILEAGCGNRWPLDIDDLDYELTAVDLDEQAVAIRRRTLRPGDRAFVGDLRRTELLPPGRFDLIYCAFVLEHVHGAQTVLDNFCEWLAPGGALILCLPDRDSVYGFVTRMTPFWFHVLYKRHVRGQANAGKPGFDPYPTVHEAVISRRGLRDWCRRRGCILKEEAGYAGFLPRRKPLLGGLLRAVVAGIGALSCGRLAWRHNNLTLLIEKPATAASAVPARRAAVASGRAGTHTTLDALQPVEERNELGDT